MGRPLPDETTGGGDAALAALESAMGAVAVKDEQFDGEIAEDDEESGRQAVVYDADALFDDEDASASAVSAAEPPAGAPADGPAETTDLAGLLDGGSAESAGALIAYLEQMAAGLEAQSGEEEKEIRGKIEVLRSVLEMRSSAVDQSLARLSRQDGPEGEGALEALGGLQALATDSLERIEHGMGAVDSMLQDDDARQLLAESAHVWMPAIGVRPDAPDVD